MKIVWSLLCLTLFAFGAEKVLYVYNWSEYMPESVLKSFQKETGIKAFSAVQFHFCRKAGQPGIV